MAQQWKTVILVLGGGNALGAFQAGAYEALHEHGLLPATVAGSSTGAVNGALIAGNPVEERLDALRALWRDIAPERGMATTMLAPLSARLFGRPGLFAPTIPRVAELPVGQPGLYELSPLRRTVDALTDLGSLSARLVVVTTDLCSGEAVVFDSAETEIRAEHVAASSALPPDFAPLAVDGRTLADGGLSANLPLNAAVPDGITGDVLVVAVDLLDPRGEPPRTVVQAAGRRLELLLAGQARLEMDKLRLRRLADGSGGGRMLVLRLVREGADEAVTDKPFDYSAESLARRWDQGYRRMTAALQGLPPPRDCAPVRVIEAR